MTQHKWTSEFVTGIEDIDRQHQKIFDFVRRLDELTAKDEARLRIFFLELSSYLAFHFRFEEALLEDAEYQFLRAHKKVHVLMSRRLNDIHQRFKNGEDVITDLHALLNSWIYNHILNDDAAYLPTVRVYTQFAHSGKVRLRWWSRLVRIYHAIFDA